VKPAWEDWVDCDFINLGGDKEEVSRGWGLIYLDGQAS